MDPTRTLLTATAGSGETLAIHRLRQSDDAEPVLLVHGSIENGGIFHSRSMKGFAPQLARNGFAAYVLDFRGRGASRPHVSRRSKWGQWELIEEDLPAALAAIEADAKRRVRLAVAHSWGGVLMSAALARRADWREQFAGVVCFGTKRCIRVRNRDTRLRIDLGWNGLFGPLASLVGYLPARAMRIGSDDESRRSLAETRAWVRPGPWIDPRDGFDYAKALKMGPRHPPVLHLMGVADGYLGHPDDVRRFAEETGAANDFRLLSLATGYRRDYGHIDMLTASEAGEDHFPEVIRWMRERLEAPAAQGAG